MKITDVSPGYCDPSVYGVLVQFVVDSKEGSSYLEFNASHPNGELKGSVKDIGEADQEFDLSTEQENLVRDAARSYYRDALIYRSESEQRASGFVLAQTEYKA